LAGAVLAALGASVLGVLAAALRGGRRLRARSCGAPGRGSRFLLALLILGFRGGVLGSSRLPLAGPGLFLAGLVPGILRRLGCGGRVDGVEDLPFAGGPFLRHGLLIR